ncbi:MAG TPA: hypothetical protein VNZ26_13250 [Vicinamibacterales bacterium]|jgi:hypothetical protein|nr:hypothetical protein [Vicinamibacterales bacterium]
MTSMSELAINECRAEVRAACRRPIEDDALDTMFGWMRPQFQKILDRTDGSNRWASHAQNVRESGRHVGALADFFAHHYGNEVVGIEELTSAMKLIRADCTVRAERVPLAFAYCTGAPVDSHLAEEFLRALVPAPELIACAS